MLIQIEIFFLASFIGVTLGLEWNSYKTTYGVRFSSANEEKRRQAIFSENMNEISEHNKKAKTDRRITYLKEINQFSYLTYTEFLTLHTGYNRSEKNIEGRSFGGGKGHGHRNKKGLATTTMKSTGCSCTCSPTATTTSFKLTTTSTTKPLPVTTIQNTITSLDWRNTPLVGPIKNQGNCGSCWAFSAISAWEGQLAKKIGTYVSLSEQQLVDCSRSNYGCQGGDPMPAFDDILRTNLKGINTNAAYPYTSGSTGNGGASCLFKSSGSPNPIGSILSSYKIDQSLVSGGYYGASAVGNENWLASTLATNGPVSVCIYVSNNFMNYKSGIFTDVKCSATVVNQMNHCVSIVGYGTDADTGKKYWILRNQWGTSWGEAGYMRLERNNGNQICVATEMYMPVLA